MPGAKSDEPRSGEAGTTANAPRSTDAKMPPPALTVLQTTQRSTDSSRRERAATVTSSTAGSVPSSRRAPGRLQLSDRRLLKIAKLAASSIDWEQLQFASSGWKQQKRAAIAVGGEFSIVTHQEGDVHHIMATGSIACSVAEMKHILWTTTSERYVSAMAELHGAGFLTGAALYRVKSRRSGDCGNDSLSSASASTDQSQHASDLDVSVKTATFAKAHVFARDEQWCYLDCFQQYPEQDDDEPFDRHSQFTLTMHSLRPEDVLPCGSNRHNPPEPVKNQLQETTAGYFVTADPRGNFVWVSFYARYIDTKGGGGSRTHDEPKYLQSRTSKSKLEASKSTIKKRLMKMAKATSFLPLIVQRRRLGAQVFTNPKSFTQLNNRHCKCCTVALTLLVQKKRCHLCGYRVCVKCSTKQQIERSRDHKDDRKMVRVCTTCTRRVNAADYDDLPEGIMSPVCVKPDSADASQQKTSKSLANFLCISFENTADASRRQALVQVAKSLLESQEKEELVDDDSDESSGVTAGSNDYHHHGYRHHSSVDSKRSDEEYMSALESSLTIKAYALDECTFAHPDLRAYPIDYQDDDADRTDDIVTAYPIPDDEQHRVDFVTQQRLSDMKNAPELEIICAIASKELGCAAGLVTIIAKDKIHIVASNDTGYQNLVVPREESICSHMVMSDQPLLLPHPAADIRFNKMPPVAHNGVRFYCGFPLLGPGNTVFGSVCCVDSKSHAVTQSQYAVMKKLATTATRVMELRVVTTTATRAA